MVLWKQTTSPELFPERNLYSGVKTYLYKFWVYVWVSLHNILNIKLKKERHVRRTSEKLLGVGVL